MTIEIASNTDLPPSLNTPSKQSTKAHHLAHLHSHISPKTTRAPHPQGFFSRTVIVTLQNDEDIVIQFRPEPLNLEPFQTARKVLGAVVPDIKLIPHEELERDSIWVYWITCVPGTTWLDGAGGRSTQTRVTTVRSLGRILPKGYLNNNSEDIINRHLRPHLALLLSSQDVQIRQFHAIASSLLNQLDRLKILPLFISHFDLNDVNIMVNDKCEVSGIVDWELSTPLPFSMGFCRIRTLAGEFSERKFYMPPEFEDAERGFWEEVEEGIPQSVWEVVRVDKDVVQIAVTLGTLLDAFQLEEGRIGPYNPVVVEALPKLLTYRLPLLRGADPPYSA